METAFVGKWRITEMEQWDQDYVDEEEPGHISFEKKGEGHFHFGYVHAYLDWRYDPAIDRLDFSFEGSCEGDEMNGRGWAKIEGKGKQMVGRIGFHLGDESGFKARKRSCIMDTKKISEMVLDFAGDYLRLGETPDERGNLLRSACSAWNIACAPEETRAEVLEQFLANYRKCNPDADAEECRSVRQDMELLIEQKIKKYPQVIKQIVSCELTVVDGKDHIFVASVRPSR